MKKKNSKLGPGPIGNRYDEHVKTHQVSLYFIYINVTFQDTVHLRKLG